MIQNFEDLAAQIAQNYLISAQQYLFRAEFEELITSERFTWLNGPDLEWN